MLAALGSYKDYGAKAESILSRVRRALARHRPTLAGRLNERGMQLMAVLVAAHPRRLDRLEMAQALGREGSVGENSNFVQPGITSIQKSGLMSGEDRVVERDESLWPYTYGVREDFVEAVAFASENDDEPHAPADILALPAEPALQATTFDIDLSGKPAIGSVSVDSEKVIRMLADLDFTPAPAPNAARSSNTNVIAAKVAPEIDFAQAAVAAANEGAPVTELQTQSVAEQDRADVGPAIELPVEMAATQTTDTPIDSTEFPGPSAIDEHQDQTTMTNVTALPTAAAASTAEALNAAFAVALSRPKPGSTAELIFQHFDKFGAMIDLGYSYADIASVFADVGHTEVTAELVERLHKRFGA